MKGRTRQLIMAVIMIVLSLVSVTLNMVACFTTGDTAEWARLIGIALGMFVMGMLVANMVLINHVSEEETGDTFYEE